MSSEEKTYKAGETLWFVPTYIRSSFSIPVEVSIIKVGRKWLELSNGHRADIKTLIVDDEGYASPATCYISQSEYEKKIALTKAWDALRSKIRDIHRAPSGITVDVIENVRAQLGI